MTTALVKRETTAMVPQPRQKYYRFHELRFSESRIMLVMTTFEVVKTTRCGVWIEASFNRRFVLNSAHKRYACPTIEEALASYHARKRRHVGILRHQLARAEAALKLQRDGEIAWVD
jgi:hypothetical protein